MLVGAYGGYLWGWKVRFPSRRSTATGRHSDKPYILASVSFLTLNPFGSRTQRSSIALLVYTMYHWADSNASHDGGSCGELSKNCPSVAGNRVAPHGSAGSLLW